MISGRFLGRVGYRRNKMYNKYSNKKVILDNIKFDSKAEKNRYMELKILEKSGLIKELELQKEFELQPSFKKNGKTYRKITYKADFYYFDNHLNRYVVEDVKGYKTDVYKLKKKMFEYRYPDLELLEVK
jgi:hypothetical protein